MAKFIFKLQGFFELKEKIEDQKKLEYGQAMKELEIEKQKKRQLEIDKNDSVISLRNKIESKISPHDIKNINLYIDFLSIKIEEQEQVVMIAEAKAESKRNELVEAMKERKMLETLREKEYEQYLKDQVQSEQKLTDEVVSYRYSERKR